MGKLESIFWNSLILKQHISIIVETDSTTIASRVSRSRADTSDIVINEQTIMNAYDTIKERVKMFRG